MSTFWCSWGQHLVSYRGTGTLLPNGSRICKDCRLLAAQTPEPNPLEQIHKLKLIFAARATLREVAELDSSLRGKT